MILITVNFLVITKGATRIAEVGARFTLDAIPGKQMAIDADLSAGLIDDKEAKRRRRELEEESAFFGSMDGASKFVRGDAIAGLIITAVNIFGGIIIGVTRHGMSPADAADVFTKLSVGDGLVTQIPALIVSLAAGLLVSKGGTRGSAEKAVLGQLGDYPRALLVAGAASCSSSRWRRGCRCCPFALLGRHHGVHRLRHPARAGRKLVAAEEAKARSDDAGGRGGGAPVGQGIAQDRRDRALPRQADLGVVRRRTTSWRSASARCAASSPSNTASSCRRSGSRDDLVHPAQEPTRSRSTARWSPARTCASARCSSSPATGRGPTCPATRRASRPSA